jgi:hypothetical protein
LPFLSVWIKGTTEEEGEDLNTKNECHPLKHVEEEWNPR